MTADGRRARSHSDPGRGGAIGDGWTLLRRNLTRLRHSPAELSGTLLCALVAVLVPGYVLGAAIGVPSGSYREFLVPGLFVLAPLAALGTGARRTAADNAGAAMDRYRSLPIARVAVPFGHTGAELVVAALRLAVLVAGGLAVGWRVRDGSPSALAALALVLLFGYAVSWLGVLIGQLVPDPDAAARFGAAFAVLGLVSNAVVPPAGLPGWLRGVAEWNPVSAATGAVRALFGNPGGSAQPGPWPLQHPVLATLGASAALLVVLVPLCAYRARP